MDIEVLDSTTVEATGLAVMVTVGIVVVISTALRSNTIKGEDTINGVQSILALGAIIKGRHKAVLVKDGS
ncbi:MAG: hypothetical protein A3C06_03625 [Candidatus Taylorbacteria bacterium RIFCSPHIGHO2_02_FULL_46_13]|uniref:Uncharacterized protein n=1 Tax=Candidatus Taylorbacteria bacterium RIFCSPHIGHO2_02_FULL_46_13 TaxID=1802312 RepID=A0A1G2MQL4_9BACT|nr:MAG: hypothetical protein A3C06_03625 [Candidatus Taylorbacteria bacterium RIFCSPHIGHO2_02_FULL_46_13]